MSIITIKDFDDLKKRLKEAGNNLVVIDSMAAWADPCKRIEPKLDQLAAEMTDSIIVLKVDVNDCGEAIIEYQIKAMPTFVFVKNSKKLEDFTGANYDNNKNIILKLK